MLYHKVAVFMIIQYFKFAEPAVKAKKSVYALPNSLFYFKTYTFLDLVSIANQQGDSRPASAIEVERNFEEQVPGYRCIMEVLVLEM